MRHLRIDYQGIQDTSNSTSIADDEPVFIVRAKDIYASQAVRVWAAYVNSAGGDVDLVRRVQEWADEMDEYRRVHFKGGKLPDVPKGMLLPTNRRAEPLAKFCPQCGVELEKHEHARNCALSEILPALQSSSAIAQSPGMRRI